MEVNILNIVLTLLILLILYNMYYSYKRKEQQQYSQKPKKQKFQQLTPPIPPQKSQLPTVIQPTNIVKPQNNQQQTINMAFEYNQADHASDQENPVDAHLQEAMQSHKIYAKSLPSYTNSSLRFVDQDIEADYTRAHGLSLTRGRNVKMASMNPNNVVGLDSQELNSTGAIANAYHLDFNTVQKI